jgi:hypothetical protein
VLKFRRALPGRSWRWPMEIARVTDLIEAVHLGFELVMVPSETDQLIYRLRRDGEISPFGTLAPSAPRAAHVARHYFITGETEPSGIIPLRLDPNRRTRAKARP